MIGIIGPGVKRSEGSLNWTRLLPYSLSVSLQKMKLVQSWSLFHKAAQPLNHLYPLLSHVEHIWRLTHSQLCRRQICPTFTSRPCKTGTCAFLAGSVLTAHRAVRHQSVISLSVSGREAGPPRAGLDISWWEHELLKIFSFFLFVFVSRRSNFLASRCKSHSLERKSRLLDLAFELM